MSSTLRSLTGGDDSGASTFARYRYQSKITLLHWLRTLLEDGPQGVYAEHVEDLVLDFGSRYEFVQIKSRSPDRHLWRASEMCDSGGGVDSLARAYAIAKDVDCVFELHLEGGSSPSAETKDFVDDCTRASDSLRRKIKSRLEEAGVPASHLNAFLGRLRVRPKQPDQSAIDSICIDCIGRLAPNVTGQEIVQLAERLLGIVENAQQARSADLASDASPEDFLRAHLVGILQLGGDTAVVHNKTLTAERLAELVPGAPSVDALLLLRRVTDTPITSGTSALERKLIGAGATAGVVESAKALRAMSELRRIELQSGSDHLVDRLEDLQNRVLTHAHAVALGFMADPAPANGIWSSLVTSFGLEVADQFDLFRRDRQGLVGLLCCISDECRFAWAAS